MIIEKGLWNKKDEDYLKINWLTTGINNLTQNLRRNKSAIQSKAKRLKLPKKHYVKVWDENEDASLIRDYQTIRDKTELSKKYDRSLSSIQHKISRLRQKGITIDCLRENTWPKEDKEYLKQNWVNTPKSEILNRLNRNWVQIVSMAQAMQLPVRLLRGDGQLKYQASNGKAFSCLKSKGYLYINVGSNWVPAHRYEAEQIIGRELTKKEIVHHKNGNKVDNRPENLAVITRPIHGHFDTIRAENAEAFIKKNDLWEKYLNYIGGT